MHSPPAAGVRAACRSSADRLSQPLAMCERRCPLPAPWSLPSKEPQSVRAAHIATEHHRCTRTQAALAAARRQQTRSAPLPRPPGRRRRAPRSLRRLPAAAAAPHG